MEASPLAKTLADSLELFLQALQALQTYHTALESTRNKDMSCLQS